MEPGRRNLLDPASFPFTTRTGAVVRQRRLHPPLTEAAAPGRLREAAGGTGHPPRERRPGAIPVSVWASTSSHLARRRIRSSARCRCNGFKATVSAGTSCVMVEGTCDGVRDARLRHARQSRWQDQLRAVLDI
ncbi:hypothetical protein HBB16_09690 [Pseudonocardia sp. MCCB 268]|nr:hypothetical protein [Pseudonocardia cytotoxica]